MEEGRPRGNQEEATVMVQVRGGGGWNPSGGCAGRRWGVFWLNFEAEPKGLLQDWLWGLRESGAGVLGLGKARERGRMESSSLAH